MKTKRTFIGLFGRRNNGKSALINALTGQDIAIVSDIAGTTTDPVKKSIEIFGIGPVVFVDTAGIDDEGELGQQRKQKSIEAIPTVDVAILVVAHQHFDQEERALIAHFSNYHTPFIIVYNKIDLEPLPADLEQRLHTFDAPVVACSAQQHIGIEHLIEVIKQTIPESAYRHDSLTAPWVEAHDLVVLVMPQDKEAPEGRLILPQVQVIRDLLDNHAVAIALQPEELPHFLSHTTPKLIITDSQVFAAVAANVPAHIPLTGFSVLLSYQKGHFQDYLQGTPQIRQLKEGDKVLILESCTHVVSCEDIGRHKLPNLLQKVTQKQLHFDFVAALNPLPNDLKQYALAIQCGGCMVSKKQLHNRIDTLIKAGVPVSNYGLALAYLTGIYDRATEIFRSEP